MELPTTRVGVRVDPDLVCHTAPGPRSRHLGIVGADAATGQILLLRGMGRDARLSLTELVAIIAATHPMDAPMVAVLGAVYGVVTVVIGAGLVALGVSALRSGVLVDWRRWIPLSLGVWVFFPMLPGIAVSFLAARLTIAGCSSSPLPDGSSPSRRGSAMLREVALRAAGRERGDV